MYTQLQHYGHQNSDIKKTTKKNVNNFLDHIKDAVWRI